MEVERASGVNGLVVVQAHGPSHFPGVSHHGPWVTAFGAEHLGGQEIAAVAAAEPALRAAIRGLTGMAVGNQGLLHTRERSQVIHALTFLQSRGFALDPDALMVEALRNEWGGTGAEDLRQIAIDVNTGKKLRFDKGQLRPERLEEWAAAGACAGHSADTALEVCFQPSGRPPQWQCSPTHWPNSEFLVRRLCCGAPRCSAKVEAALQLSDAPATGSLIAAHR